MKYIIAILLSLFLTTTTQASMEDAYNATGKVWVLYHKTIDGKLIKKYVPATGIVFKQDDEDDYWVLTAGHVTKPTETFKINEVVHEFKRESIFIQFYYTGLMSSLIRCDHEFQIYKKHTVDDLAVLTFHKDALNGYKLPTIIPLASKNYKAKPSDIVMSCGCAQYSTKSSWPTLFKGHITHVEKYKINFKPSPRGGRSGSALLNEDGTYILGIVIWAAGGAHPERGGTAVSLTKIYSHLEEILD